MKALIAGAGIGGLTTALQLHRLGIEAAIFESVRELKPPGAGINLLPHGVKVLHELGLEETAIKTREIVHGNRSYGPEAFMQIVDERIKAPEDRVEDVITKEEIEAITAGYRKVAGFDQDKLNTDSGDDTSWERPKPKARLRR